jgi:protein phosphatase
MDAAAVSQSSGQPRVSYIWAGSTDPGVVRDHNEDAVHPSGTGGGDAGVVGVADGLGGHPGGDVASRLAIETVATAEQYDPAELVADARRRVVEHLMVATEETPELIAMATTLTVAMLRPASQVAVGHVGDSRLYLLRDGVLHQITEDHTIAVDMVRRGELTPEEAEEDPAWHVISNWIGFERSHVETHEISVEPGDRLLLCTDGLSNMVDDSQIEAILGEPSLVEACAERLIAAANEAGGLDNISVAVVDVVEP